MAPIDSSRRERLIRFLSVSNGYELRFLQSSQVDVFLRGGGRRTPLLTNVEGMFFKIGVFRPILKITPIDSPRRGSFFRFLSVSNGYELRFLRSSQVDVF